MSASRCGRSQMMGAGAWRACRCEGRGGQEARKNSPVGARAAICAWRSEECGGPLSEEARGAERQRNSSCMCSYVHVQSPTRAHVQKQSAQHIRQKTKAVTLGASTPLYKPGNYVTWVSKGIHLGLRLLHQPSFAVPGCAFHEKALHIYTASLRDRALQACSILQPSHAPQAHSSPSGQAVMLTNSNISTWNQSI
eukprot:1158867-Pelagomonas_calceolata.AAC.35